MNKELVQKWEKSGLLEDITNKVLMAKILEDTINYIKSKTQLRDVLAEGSIYTWEERVYTILIILVRKVFTDRCNTINVLENNDIPLEKIREEIIILAKELLSDESIKFFDAVDGWSGIDAEMELIQKVYSDYIGIIEGLILE